MQLQFQRPARYLPSAITPERLRHSATIALEVLVLAIVAWQLARLVWMIVTPVTPLGGWQPAAQAPAAADRSILGSFDPFFRGVADDNAAVSSLSLILSGTRTDAVSGRGSAIITTADGVASSYSVGDTIEPGVVLTAVGFDHATIDRGDTREKLFIDQSAGGSPVTTPDAPAGAQASQAGTRLAADVNIIPRLKGSTLTGYILTPKGSGAAFAAAGLEPGDALVSVNGATVTSLRDIAGLTQQLEAGGIDITVERAGRPVTLRIGGK